MNWLAMRADGSRREIWEATYLSNYSEGFPPIDMDTEEVATSEGYGAGRNASTVDGAGYGSGQVHRYGLRPGAGYGDGSGGTDGSGCGEGLQARGNGAGDGKDCGEGKRPGGEMLDLKPGDPLVLVTDHEHPTIAFGYLVHRDAIDRFTLRDVKLCIYYGPATRGYLGLGVYGPDAESCIGAGPEEMELGCVAHVMRAMPDAVARWEATPWR